MKTEIIIVVFSSVGNLILQCTLQPISSVSSKLIRISKPPTSRMTNWHISTDKLKSRMEDNAMTVTVGLSPLRYLITAVFANIPLANQFDLDVFIPLGDLCLFLHHLLRLISRNHNFYVFHADYHQYDYLNVYSLLVQNYSDL